MRCVCCGALTLPYGGEDVCECHPCSDCGACCHTAHTDGCRAEFYEEDEDAAYVVAAFESGEKGLTRAPH